MSYDNKIMILQALGAKRNQYLTNWLSAHDFLPADTAYWAERLRNVNDAEMELRNALGWAY